MTILCVDDEALILQLAVSMCRELPGISDVQGFRSAAEAIKWLETHTADVALLDINMPGINGLMLAKVIRETHPDTAVIFLTGYPQYALEAIGMHVSGYLLKPIDRERLAGEVAYALSHHPAQKSHAHIAVQTFGGFDLYVNGQKAAFKRSKSKELLAYLVDRQGASVKRAAAFAILWENAPYDRSMQKQMDVIIRSLRATLSEYGIADILQMRGGEMWIAPEKLDCDLYRFLQGDPQAVNAYRGEYMSLYSWASFTEARLEQRMGRSEREAVAGGRSPSRN